MTHLTDDSLVVACAVDTNYAMPSSPLPSQTLRCRNEFTLGVEFFHDYC
jgi:hypothetical protein